MLDLFAKNLQFLQNVKEAQITQHKLHLQIERATFKTYIHGEIVYIHDFFTMFELVSVSTYIALHTMHVRISSNSKNRHI
jgi:hypothetical protein